MQKKRLKYEQIIKKKQHKYSFEYEKKEIPSNKNQ
jgi:hypothetical protein